MAPGSNTALRQIKAPGFTLVELLISIAIFLLITAMVLVSFRSGQYRDELAGAAQVIQASLREMQTATFSGSAILCSSTLQPVEPVGGYGVHFQPGAQPIAFADCGDPGNSYAATYRYKAASDPLIKTVQLPNSSRTNLTALSPSDAGGLDIMFSKTAEAPVVNGNQNYSGSNLTITLQHTVTNSLVCVEVNPITGQVFTTGIALSGQPPPC